MQPGRLQRRGHDAGRGHRRRPPTASAVGTPATGGDDARPASARTDADAAAPRSGRLRRAADAGPRWSAPGTPSCGSSADLDFDKREHDDRAATSQDPKSVRRAQSSIATESYTGNGAGAGGVLGTSSSGVTTHDRQRQRQLQPAGARYRDYAVGKVTENRPVGARLGQAAVRRRHPRRARGRHRRHGGGRASSSSTPPGCVPSRGDSIVVSRMPFDETAATAAQEELKPPPAAKQRKDLLGLAKTVAALLAVVIVVLLRPPLRPAAAVPAPSTPRSTGELDAARRGRRGVRRATLRGGGGSRQLEASPGDRRGRAPPGDARRDRGPGRAPARGGRRSCCAAGWPTGGAEAATSPARCPGCRRPPSCWSSSAPSARPRCSWPAPGERGRGDHRRDRPAHERRGRERRRRCWTSSHDARRAVATAAGRPGLRPEVLEASLGAEKAQEILDRLSRRAHRDAVRVPAPGRPPPGAVVPVRRAPADDRAGARAHAAPSRPRSCSAGCPTGRPGRRRAARGDHGAHLPRGHPPGRGRARAQAVVGAAAVRAVVGRRRAAAGRHHQPLRPGDRAADPRGSRAARPGAGRGGPQPDVRVRGHRRRSTTGRCSWCCARSRWPGPRDRAQGRAARTCATRS